jgi:hypothetical protein
VPPDLHVSLRFSLWQALCETFVEGHCSVEKKGARQNASTFITVIATSHNELKIPHVALLREFDWGRITPFQQGFTE